MKHRHLLRIGILGLMLWAASLSLPGCGQPSADGFHEVTEVALDEAGDVEDSIAPIDGVLEEATDLAEVKPVSPEPVTPDEPTVDSDSATETEVPVETVATTDGANADDVQTDGTNNGTTEAAATPAAPSRVKLLIKDKTFKVEGPQKALRITYDDFDLLKVLNMEPVPLDALKHFPKWLNDLDGKRVRVRGFMYPPFQDTDISSFVLARDNQICCFGKSAKPYDLVAIAMREGVTTDYILNRPFDVIGTFHIDPIMESDEEFYSMYRIKDATIVDR